MPVSDYQKFDSWLEGTGKFFNVMKDDRKDCRPWLLDAYRIAQRLDPTNAPQPYSAELLNKHQATVVLEGLRNWCAQMLRVEVKLNKFDSAGAVAQRSGPLTALPEPSDLVVQRENVDIENPTPDLSGDGYNVWATLRDVPPDQAEKLPSPVGGDRFHLALAQPALDGYAELRGEKRYSPKGPIWLSCGATATARMFAIKRTAFFWALARKMRRGFLSAGRWTIFPTGWTLAHLEHWFAYAFSIANIEDRGDIPQGTERSPHYLPTPRGLIAHAHKIVRHLNLPGCWPEPRGEMDRHGCFAELEELRRYFRGQLPLDAIQATPIANSGAQQHGPYAVGCFRWGQVNAKGIPTDQWRLLQALFVGDIPNAEVVPDGELIEQVYGAEAEFRETALKSLRQRLNTTLAGKAIRAEVERPRKAGGLRFISFEEK